MITCKLGDKNYCVDFISGRALRELEPAAKMYARIVAISNAAANGEEVPESDTLTIGYVETYAEATSGVDVSALTPENITAIVAGYEELAEGADISTLKPSDIVAHVTKYLQDEGVDMTGLTPEVLTATVLAYEEVSGGALTTALTPDDIAATVVKYLEAEGVDISALSPDQVEAIVNAYAEATNCDKSELLTSLTAVITDYQVAPGVEPPTIQARVGLTGYDTIAYRKFVQQNEVKVNGIVRLNEVYCSFAVNFRCGPFWYDAEEASFELAASGQFIDNPGTVAAEPVITVYGSGEITLMQKHSHLAPHYHFSFLPA